MTLDMYRIPSKWTRASELRMSYSELKKAAQHGGTLERKLEKDDDTKRKYVFYRSKNMRLFDDE